MDSEKRISPAVINRLPRYYRYLGDLWELFLKKDVSVGYLAQNQKIESDRTIYEEMLSVFRKMLGKQEPAQPYPCFLPAGKLVHGAVPILFGKAQPFQHTKRHWTKWNGSTVPKPCPTRCA